MEKSIPEYFSNSKKRDLSDNSKEETSDDPKKLREESPRSENEEVFNESESTSTTAQFLTVLKKLESRVDELFLLANNNKETQIKGASQLAGMKESVDLMSETFEKFKEELKRKDEVIKSLRGHVSKLQSEMNVVVEGLDRQEQYSRRNCLLIHGINENKDEDTDDIVIKTLNSDLNLDLSINDLDRTHRIGKSRVVNATTKSRPIIVKFARYIVRRKVFSNKKKLKGKNISITESLTKKRMEKLKEARDQHGFGNVWTYDGRILIKTGDSSKPSVYYD